MERLGVTIRAALKNATNWFKRLGGWLSAVIVWLGQLRIWGIAVLGPTNLLAVFAAGTTFWLCALSVERLL